MGQETKKYHITDDGKIYKINDDGSFTELGNAENLNSDKQSAAPEPKLEPDPELQSYYNFDPPKKNGALKWILIASCILIVFVTLAIIIMSRHRESGYDYDEEQSDEWVAEAASIDSVSAAAAEEPAYSYAAPAALDFNPGSLQYAGDFNGTILYRNYENSSLYCNGEYPYDSDTAQYLYVNLNNMNRYHFSIQLQYWPLQTGPVVVLSEGYRILEIKITDDWKLAVTTNNGRYVYLTNITVNNGTWNPLRVEYYNGQMLLNGQVCKHIVMNMNDGDNILSSINYSNAQCFKGWLSSIEVCDYYDI